MHSPRLLVLDEPTVGLDPLLRRSIWHHLYETAQNLGTTIIITTHYIEEARFSNTIGVMRKGLLLVEDTPTNLLQNYNSELLEKVVLHLCRQDEGNRKSLTDTQSTFQQKNEKMFQSRKHQHVKSSSIAIGIGKEHEGLPTGAFRKGPVFDCEVNQPHFNRNPDNEIYGRNNDIISKIIISMVLHALLRVFGFTMVILFKIARNPVFTVWLLSLPSIIGGLSLITLGSKPRDLHLGIVNLELTNWTLECDLPSHFGNSCEVSALSCKYLNELRSDDLFSLKSYDSEDEARSQAQLGNIWGYLKFPYNYSQHTLDLVTAQHFALNGAIEGSRIHAHLDQSQYIHTFLMVKHLYSTYLEYVSHIAESCQINGLQSEFPLQFRKPVYGEFEDDFTTFIVPGVIQSLTIGLGYGLTGLLLVADRNEGTLSRAHVAGLVTSDVFTGHLLAQVVIGISQIVIWNATLYFGFGYSLLDSPGLMITFIMTAQICGCAMGIFVAQICKTSTQVLLVSMFLFTIFVFFGCVFVPVERMLWFWKQIAYLTPTHIPTGSMRSVLSRGMDLTAPLVWSGLLVYLAWILVFLIGGVALYRKTS